MNISKKKKANGSAYSLGPEGILVNAIAPGVFATKMMAGTLKKNGDKIVEAVPLRRVGSPEDIAGTCLYLSSRAGHYTTGAIITCDGGSVLSRM